MAFNLFKKSKETQTHLDIPEEMLLGTPFGEIIACMNPQYLEDAVSSHFEDILCHLSSDEYAYIRLYPSWVKLLGENLENLMEKFDTMREFNDLITAFPEFASYVYEYLIKDFLAGTKVIDLHITDDVLIPMSDLERYHGCHFPIISEMAMEILDETEDYKEFWDALQVLEQYFNIPRKYFTEYLKTLFEDVIEQYARTNDDFDNGKITLFDADDYDELIQFFMDREAFDAYMGAIPELLSTSGLELYTILIKILGPMPEIVSLHDICAEFINQK